MKNSYNLPVKLSEDLVRKLAVICEAENRTPSAQFVFMLRNYVAYFERTKGKIPPAKLNEVDIEKFLEEN